MAGLWQRDHRVTLPQVSLKMAQTGRSRLKSTRERSAANVLCPCILIVSEWTKQIGFIRIAGENLDTIFPYISGSCKIPGNISF